jgi:DNA-binding NtrC family response regulator
VKASRKKCNRQAVQNKNTEGKKKDQANTAQIKKGGNQWTTDTTVDFKDAVEEFERSLIIKALRQCNGNKSKAAEIMNLPRRSLHRKIEAYQSELRTEVS